MGNENIYGEQDSLSVINDYAQELLKVCDKQVQIQLIELIISTCSSSLSPSPSPSPSLSPSPLSSTSPIYSPSSITSSPSIITSPATRSPSPRCLLPESALYSQHSPNGQTSSSLIPQPVNRREFFNCTSPQIDLLLSRDWSKTSMGPVETWCPQLRSLIDTIMMAEVAMLIMWGEELYSIYNKAHSYLMGGKDFTFGLPYKENWPEKWEFVAPIFKLAMPGGKGIIHHDHCLDAIQNGGIQECFFTWSQSPIFIQDGSVGGIFVVCIETTSSVLGKRRAGILYSMSQNCETSSVADTVESVTKELSNHPKDIPFSLIYLKESDSSFRLRAMHGLPEDHIMAPKLVDLNAPQSDSSWPFLQALNSSEIVIVEVRRVFGDVTGSAWPESIKYASVQPIYTPNSQKPFGFVISAASPRNILDTDYKNFLQLVVLQISASIATSLSREQERLRADELAENDRLRTTFFHNVSHELRTPLMLMLGPLESVLAGPALPAETRSLFDLLYSNAHRLRRLVNNLLDFAKVEARVSKGHFSSVDISQITKNYACVFKEASIQAGLQFVMKLPYLGEEVYVDTDMWELVVSNLLSNALKFTKEGKIEIEVRKDNEWVEMLVSDTGVGISKENFENLFSRFSNFKTDFNRTNEGTGIGLSLSRELIRIHGGNIEVSSEPGKGTIFTVRIPIGKEHLPIEQVNEKPSSAVKFLTDMQSRTTSPKNRNNNNEKNKCININEITDAEMNDEVQNDEVHNHHLQSPHTYPDVPRILLVDDNADMRVYISGLLKKQGWEVILACDGEEAYQKATEMLPDLVLSDVMMPKLNGFQLLSCLRENKTTCHLPVILLSARGGEDAQLEGLKMGADDYLLKPCSEAQIVVRVNLHLELGRLRANLQREVDCRLTELDQVHANLLASEEQFRTLAALSPVGIVRFRDNHFCYYNDRWGEITGVKGLYGVAGEWDKVIYPVDRDRINQRWQEFLEKKITVMSEEVRYVKPNGNLTHALLEANYITEGTEQGYVIVATDITEIKDLEQQRLEAVTKAEEAQRKRAQDAEHHKQLQEQFVNTICHEIRNPLNGIYNNAQLLQSSISTRMDTLNKASCDDGTRKYLKDMILGDKDAIEAIFICAAHQKMITNDVLDTSKIESGSMTLSELPFDATRTITTTAKMFYTEMSSKGIELKTNLPESVPVCGDNNRLSQVMINLLSNSIKFTAKSPVKVITVSLASQCISPDSVRLSISVADTGLGMTEEEQALIFERFKQGNRDISINYGGHGLGLYICKNLVEMMHGTINVTSERNTGTTITFTIECKKSTDGGISNYTCLEPPAPTVPIQSISIAKKRNILVVEDNPINQKVLTRQLTKLGHACCIANNGKEAVDKLLPSNESNYDVVLMDIQMPVMDGLQATQIIRHQEKLLHLESIPIIGLSGNATKSQIEEAYEAGMMDFIAKPYEIKDLLHKIENVLLL